MSDNRTFFLLLLSRWLIGVITPRSSGSEVLTCLVPLIWSKPLFLLAAIVGLRGSPSIPTQHLSQRKKRTWDDVFSKILQASAALYLEKRA
ncbi:unnamed protein product [Caretta caretta]